MSGSSTRIRQVLAGVLTLMIVALPAQAFAIAADPAANGSFEVQVERDGVWVDAGSLAFGMQYTTGTLDLPAACDSVRLLPKGGTAAHLDSVALGGSAPVAVEGSTDPLAVAKLKAADNDVTGVSGAIVITFPCAAKRLEINARIQGDLTYAYPFEYPVENTFSPVTADSAFYAYDTGAGPQAIDTASAPFVSAFTTPGTGHPAGYTYVWVADDDENLLVTVDFTPDNTMDDNEDYAIVHVNTPSGVRDLKITAGGSPWGSVEFAYTDKVTYQHKVYSFVIPWSEIGGKADDVHLAFTTYGTAAIMIGKPVFRFYNAKAATHFYTASAAERDTVIATWPDVFTYEGIAFSALGDAPFPPAEPYRASLYRFFNMRNGSHFYTISAEEKASIEAKYPLVYRYEGVAFDVVRPNTEYSLTPVYRFYNVKNGAHFYTASDVERASVMLLYPDTYRFEGIGFEVFGGAAN
ncbi:MAG: hypothetical protein EG823_04220 [Actinobacteria bacterium]|nr:hypothetical protein [Actinomycetota bacterium]